MRDAVLLACLEDAEAHAVVHGVYSTRTATPPPNIKLPRPTAPRQKTRCIRRIDTKVPTPTTPSALYTATHTPSKRQLEFGA